jgi:hypothetical protein
VATDDEAIGFKRIGDCGVVVFSTWFMGTDSIEILIVNL